MNRSFTAVEVVDLQTHKAKLGQLIFALCIFEAQISLLSKYFKLNSVMIKNKNGISILEVLIAAGIMTILMAGFSSMLLNQNKESRAVAEILAAQDLQKSIIGIMARGDVCQYLLAPKTFNATQVAGGVAYEIDMGNQPIYAAMVTSGTPSVAFIKKGDKASGFTNSLIVESIKFIIESGTISGNQGSFVGRWIIDFDGNKSVRKLKPVSVAAVINADTTIATAAKSISCLGSGGGSGSGQPNFIAKWETDSLLSDSDIYENPATGNIGIGTSSPASKLHVNGVLSSGKVQIIDVVTENTACTSNGLVARDAAGLLLSCQTGLWKKATGSGMNKNGVAYSDIAVASSGPPQGPGVCNPPTATCTGGKNVVAGSCSGSPFATAATTATFVECSGGGSGCGLTATAYCN